MNKLEERLMQFEEQPKKSKKGKCVILGVVIFVLLLVLVISFFKRDEIVDFFHDNMKKDKEKVDIDDILDDFKVYDRESGLVVPQPKVEYSYVNTFENIDIGATEVSASMKGYEIGLKFKLHRYNDNTRVNLKKVYIDDYVTDVEGISFDLTRLEEPYETSVIIKKTELDALGINDFNKITLLLDFSRVDKYGQVNKYYKCIDIYMNQVIPVDNSKTGLIRLDNAGGVQFNFYKLVTDKENNYLYFELFETNKASSSIHVEHHVSVNKLLLNDSVYDVTETTDIYTAGRRVYMIRIPKKDINKIESSSISFMVKNYIDGEVSGYYLSNQISFDV